MRWALQKFETLNSTQDFLRHLALEQAAEGTVIQALQQTGGHGRHGRTWISEPGNLYMSFLLRPHCDVRLTGQIALLTGMAVAQTLNAYLGTPETLRLKWPNDVLIDGRKCAGILLETQLANNKALDAILIGVGINIHSSPSDHATCAARHMTEKPDIDKLRDAFLNHFAGFFENWKRHGFDALRGNWLALAHRRGDGITVKIGETLVSGAFYDIDELGNMVLKTKNNEMRTITAGDVYMQG